MEAEDKPKPRSESPWSFGDCFHGFWILVFISFFVFRIVRLPFRSVQGVRVEFDQGYICENMRGKVYWLHPESAESLLIKKRSAKAAPCEIDERRWYETAVCETHRLEVKADEGVIGWILNY
jgi:hypothetical protein